MDLELESGEYFLSEKKKSERKWQEKMEKQAEKTVENKRKREAAFVPPKVLYICTSSVVLNNRCYILELDNC
jgi:hypothetical protein